MSKTLPNIFIVILVVLAGLVGFGVYRLHIYVTDFSNRSAGIHAEVQKLEDQKKTNELYKKIISTGSKEQEQLDTYILSGDAVFKAITDLEKDSKKTGLFTDAAGIVAVSKRDNEILKEFNAGEVVVQISIAGEKHDIDFYIQALANLPYASYIEKISLTFPKDSTKARAEITLIITELI